MEEIIRNEWQSLRMNVNSKVFKIDITNNVVSQTLLVCYYLPCTIPGKTAKEYTL